MLLSLRHRIISSANQVRKGEWRREENRGSELSGKTIGIIGFGNTGAAFAHLLKPFNVTVLAYDKYKYGFSEGYIKEASLEHICRYADVVSFHVPLTDETFHMGNGELFRSMALKPYIINTARGSVVNITELIECLKQQQIAGAALDVLENENLATLSDLQRNELAWLTEQPNVIVTPHIAGYSIEAFERMGTVLLQKLGIE